MYEIFKTNRKQIPYNKLKELYKGRWILLANLQKVYSKNEEGEFIPNEYNSCEVVVTSDEPYEGSETGIYKEISNNYNEYGMIGAMDLRILPPLNTNQIVVKEASYTQLNKVQAEEREWNIFSTGMGLGSYNSKNSYT